MQNPFDVPSHYREIHDQAFRFAKERLCALLVRIDDVVEDLAYLGQVGNGQPQQP